MASFDIMLSYLANDEESFNKLLSPDPDHLRRGPSHVYMSSCVKKSSKSEQYFRVTRPDRQTDPNALPLHAPTETRVTTAQLLEDTYPRHCSFK